MSAPGRGELPPGARPPHRVVWVNGRLVAGAEAGLSLFDRGARDGEGLFETLAVRDGRPFLWERHMERMVLAAAELGFPVPPSSAQLRRALDQVLEANGLVEAAARITVTRGIPGGRPVRAGAWVDAEPLGARLWHGTRTGEARAMISLKPFEPGPLGAYKTTSRLAYHLAREEARSVSADEALLVSPAGDLLEGAVSNVFVLIGGEVVTPPLSRGILPGVTRAFTLGMCRERGIRVREDNVPRSLLPLADEMFLTNALQGVVPLASLDGWALPARAIGTTLREAHRAEAARAAPARSP